MRIVNLEEFRKQPIGTFFCKYEPCVFGNFELFGGIFGDNDYLSSELIAFPKSSGSDEMFDILHAAEKDGNSFELETECYGRDGLYETDQLFAIYEKKDVSQLIETLKQYYK